jgi:putative GTP pyrophosphokinase
MDGKTPEDWGNDFTTVRPQFNAFTSALHRLLNDLLGANQIEVAQIESRAKGVESFVNKIRRKNEKYGDPLSEVTDLCGARIIAYYPSDVQLIGDLIEQEFDVDWTNSVRQVDDSEPERFGYRADHYVVALAEDRYRLAEWTGFRELKAEIQVRTVMQHAWAAVDHKIRYKREDLPQSLQRRLYRLSAMLEIADEQFMAIRQESLEVFELYERTLSGGDFDIDLDVLSLRGFMQATKANVHWTLTAEKIGFRHFARSDDPEFDQLSSEESGLSRLLDVLRDLKRESISDIQQILSSADQWGESALSRTLHFSAEAGFTPVAVPEDVISMLILFHGGNLAAVDRTGWRPVLRAGIKDAIREKRASEDKGAS